MRGFLESFLNRLRERRGRRPAPSPARAGLRLEQLEDRRLLSVAPAAPLPLGALLDPNLNPAVVSTRAASAPLPLGALLDPNLDPNLNTTNAPAPTPVQVSSSTAPAGLLWHSLGTYRIPLDSSSSDQAAGQTNTGSADGTAGQTNASSADKTATQTNAAVGNMGQATPPASTPPVHAATTAATPVSTSSDSYYSVKVNSTSLWLAVHTTVTASSSSSSAADAAGGATPASGQEGADDGGARAGWTMTVSLSVALDPSSAAPDGPSAPAESGGGVATLSVVVTPSADGQSVGVSVRPADGAANGSGDGAPAGASFSFNLVLVLSPDGTAVEAFVVPTSSASTSASHDGGTGKATTATAFSPPSDAATAVLVGESGGATDAGKSADLPTTSDLALAVEALLAGATAPVTAPAHFVADAAWESVGRLAGAAATAARQGGAGLAWAARQVIFAKTGGTDLPEYLFFLPDVAANGANPPVDNARQTESASNLPSADAPFVLGGVLLPVLGGRGAAAASADAGAAQGNLPIAELVQESTDSLTALVRGFYRRLMGRSAGGGEEQGWVAAMLAGQTQEQFLEAFLATAEFGDRSAGLVAAGTPDARYVGALHLVLLQRPATAEELSAWTAALPELGRDGVAASLVRSNEFRALQVQGFYQEIYGASAATGDAAQWVASPLHLLAIREALAARPDLFAPESAADSAVAST